MAAGLVRPEALLRRRTEAKPGGGEETQSSRATGRTTEDAGDAEVQSCGSPLALCSVGKHIRRAIRAAEKLVGLFVALEPLACSVELQRSAEAVGNVPQVAEGRRQVALFNWRLQVL